ncbi:MAG: 50S ribosomal protein L28 [Planctomycetes bacterium]|jgi:large subunit ribosomal protein L28|nr:50S ribosomal protein L28 [Candidatus Woesearchaeota archaeon]MBJ76682.1 50S ribosomal protein L28 [Planctomycetota bacterium]MBV21517.1 50S ribosomal protein L28 [Planctomycetaceae bacterium]MDP6385428.1 50S ribosomal protein L28 [Planctomycetota bacterium]MDP6938836.1 50S ribosomal protein L28 [Planctomycetota bacterium]
MSRTCEVTGRGTRVGGTIARRGLPKKDGGVGLRTTGKNKRKFKVNVQKKRLWVPELGEYVTVKLSTRALRTVMKNGAYPTLLKAGLIRPKRAAAKS